MRQRAKVTARIQFLLALSVSFSLMMVSLAVSNASAEPPSRLFLQQVSPNSAIVKWRGDAGEVCFSRKFKRLSKPGKSRCVEGVLSEGNHYEASLTHLKPGKKYYYSVAGQADRSQRFKTAPKSRGHSKGHHGGGRSGHRRDRDDDDDDDHEGNVHMWIVGDSGTVSDGEHPGEAAGVRDGFFAYEAAHGKKRLDLFLMLGDNAYTRGTDAEYQVAVFELYKDVLKGTGVWSTIGNHEMGTGSLPAFGIFDVGGVSVSSDPNSFSDGNPLTPDTGMPYLDIFSLPTAGEVGGVPSGTEQYYSFDYGGVHVVSLDSQLTARDTVQREAMRTWLIADLSANRSDWTVVIFHHPPYSYGTHNSDSDSLLMQSFANYLDLPMVDMRREFTPIFDDYGVDVVYTGHSHGYERSYYIGGYTGDAVDFDPQVNAELNRMGEPAVGSGREKYHQITASGLDDKVVYTVAGNSGKASTINTSITPDPLQFPANVPQSADPEGRRGLSIRGSVVIDANENRLRARMIDSEGAVLDEFVIRREDD